MAIVRLTTLEKFKKLLGEENAAEYTSPYLSPDDDDYLYSFIDLASEYVAGRLPTYDPTTLANSVLLQRITGIYAGWVLSHEKDSPAHFATGMAWAMDVLDQIRNGQITLTEATRSDDGPGVLNYRYEPYNFTFPVVPDWWATSRNSLPRDLYHGWWWYAPLSGWLW